MALQEDDIVISGIGGRFPSAESLSDLSEKLFSGTDLLTLDTANLTKGFNEDLPERCGKLPNNFEIFDYTYFGISKAVASVMDSMSGQFLQRTFEAVIDAGINPSDLRGTDSSVFTGACHSDSDLEWSSNMKVGYGIMGRNRCMNSNRISYWLDLNGASFSTDSGWTNGMNVLYQGWEAIKSGKSDTAIVGTCSLPYMAISTLQFKDFGVLSPDGYTRCFDDSANGWARSSAVIVLVLQRASIAKRSYATIGHVSSTVIGDKQSVLSQPTTRDWKIMLNEFYEKSKINIDDIYYVEAHGSGIKEEDAAELNALSDVFCKNRKSPLLIGSVKSNMGHCESSSAFAGIVKAILAFENGKIPPNLHYEKPNSLCPALFKETLKVVTEVVELPPNAWIAVNTHSFGGTYGHVVLKPNMKMKNITVDGIPRLVLLAGRTNDYMPALFEKVESFSYDPEYIALLHEIHSKKVDRYFGRGYTILPKPKNPVHENQVYSEEKRPLWFVFSGMGSQWPGMGKRLMDIPLFRESIERSHNILESKGLNLLKIITEDDPTIFDNILNSFVGIAAIQIGIVDILNALKIVPDGMIGHSVGELGCSYADGCFTAEQMILAAYYRGRASREAELIKGSMAAVGKQYKDIQDDLPEDLDVACHNSDDNCTLSGPTESISKFVASLKESGVFAKAINVSNIAYHSRYIKPAAPSLLKYLKQIVPEPKLRSPKWISTSNPEDKWDTDTAKYCSAEYHTNNLLSCVLFQEGSKHIPKNAVCIEIAPHGLLQAILKRSLGDEVTNIPLTNRFSSDPLIFFLQALGKMYMAGVDFSVMNLYPKIEFPVSRGTRPLGDLPHWYEQDLIPKMVMSSKRIIHSLKSRINQLSGDELGMIINGKNRYPLSIIVGLLWELSASQNKLDREKCPVTIRNFKMNDLVDVNLAGDDAKSMYFLNGSGAFEIVENDESLGCGTILPSKEKPLSLPQRSESKPDFVKREIYDELRQKGFKFGKYFESLLSVTYGEKEILGEIPATASWYQIIEAMCQLQALHVKDSPDFVAVPLAFDELEISCLEHIRYRDSLDEKSNLIVVYELLTNTVTCGGLKLKRLKHTLMPRHKNNFDFKPTSFYPYLNPDFPNVQKFADFCFGILMANLDGTFCGFSILQIGEEQQGSESVGDFLQRLHSNVEMMVESVPRLDRATSNKNESVNLVICFNDSLKDCAKIVSYGGFILVKMRPDMRIPSELILIARFVDSLKREYLFLRRVKSVEEEFEFINVDKETEAALTLTLSAFKSSKKNRCLVTRLQPAEDIESYRAKIQAKTVELLRWIFILDSSAPNFDPEIPFYKEQLKKGLTTNIYCKGAWGCFYKYRLAEDESGSGVNFKLDDINEIDAYYIGFDPSENLVKLDQVEFSGKWNGGTRVMGISRLSNHRKIVVDTNLIWEIPESWTLEDGATVPLAYTAAYYSLVILSKAKSSQRVLITDAMSYMGQAHVAVALYLKCHVYATVSDDEEMAKIKTLFPQIRDVDVRNHNVSGFDVVWRVESEKDGMNVIVNLLDDERFFSIVKLRAEFGFIFHYGKKDLKKNSQLGTYIFLFTSSLYVQSPDVISRLPEADKKTLQKLVADGMKKGVVKPLPRLKTTVKHAQEFQRKLMGRENQFKSLLEIQKGHSESVKIDSESSYLILGDGTHLWIDVVEWLLYRKVGKIVVGRRDVTKRGNLRSLYLKNKKKIIIRDHQDVETLLAETRRMGPLSAVFYLSMDHSGETATFKNLDKLYREASGHLVVISESQGMPSETCAARNKSGLPSTNYIWKVDTDEINAHLELMGKFNGRCSVVFVEPPLRSITVDNRLADILPSTLNEFCDLGSSLREKVEIVPLNTFSGSSPDSLYEITPFLVIPGLQGEPIATLQPPFSAFLYPVACVKIPDLNLSIKQMVTFILPEIVKYNNGNVYNIIGISWGSHLAIEITRELEMIGATVGLILIEGLDLNVESLVTRSLEWDLLNYVQTKFKTSGESEGKNPLREKMSWKAQLNAVVNVLHLPDGMEENFARGVDFVYNSVKALVEYDVTGTDIKGPLTIIVSNQRQFEDKDFSRICKSLYIRRLPVGREDMINSKELWTIVHGSAVSQFMNKNTVHACSWPPLENYMVQKENTDAYKTISACNVKFSFSC